MRPRLKRLSARGDPVDVEDPRLSVIVPTFGTQDRLGHLLERLAKQTLAPDAFEVIAVDDGSPEPLTIDAEAWPYPVEIHRQENAGPAAARNRALSHCRAPLVLILNDDALPAEDLLEGHLEVHRDLPPKTAVMGSFPFTEEARRSPFVQLLSESSLLFDFENISPGQRHDWRYFWTCNLSMPLEALLAVGGFDTDFREPVMEDTEIGYRLSLEGWEVLYRPELLCEHDHTLSAQSYFRRMERYGANLYRMFRKHDDPAILGLPDRNLIEPYLQRLQTLFERLHGPFQASLESLERLEDAHRGRPLPPSIRQDAIRVVGDLRTVPMLRGIVLERHDCDPYRVIEEGPPKGEATRVVVVSYNAEAKTRNCLDALRETATADHPIAITVVDNGSTDGSVDYLRAQRDIELIENRENRGAPRARNQAIIAGDPRDVVFLDNDVVVYSGWLERMRYHAAIDPAVGCVVPCADRAAHGQQVETPPVPTPEARRAFAARRATTHHRRGRYKTLFTSLCVWVRSEVLEAIGGFDELFSPWGFEDDDFSLRAHLAGYRTRLAEDVFVHHAHYADAAKESRHRRHLEQNWMRFAEKWGGRRKTTYGAYDFLDPILQGERPGPPLEVPIPPNGGSR